jgi:hypothetical protein
MWHYYKKYLRRWRLLDIVVAGGIALRCIYLLGWNKAKRLLGRQRA